LPSGFCLAVRVLSRPFRRLFLDQLVSAFEAGQLQFFARLEPLRDRTTFPSALLLPDAQGNR
jgi:hypothetical protein